MQVNEMHPKLKGKPCVCVFPPCLEQHKTTFSINSGGCVLNEEAAQTATDRTLF